MNSIFVFSTYARDSFFDERRKLLFRRKGGPLFFLEKVFKEELVPYRSFFGQVIDVEIFVSERGESGRALQLPRMMRFPDLPQNSFVVISTVLPEWDLQSFAGNFSGFLFLDIQGYVRKASIIGRKCLWKGIELFQEKIFCLKGTDEEMRYVPNSLLEEQKKKLLLITHGSEGVSLYYRNKFFFLRPSPVKHLKHTVGAGDTFFGYFVVAFYRGMHPVTAGRIACDKTKDFLDSDLFLN